MVFYCSESESDASCVGVHWAVVCDGSPQRRHGSSLIGQTMLLWVDDVQRSQ
jgi:hypothetical protein